MVTVGVFFNKSFFSLTKIDYDVMEICRFSINFIMKKLMVCPILKSTQLKPISSRVARPMVFNVNVTGKGGECFNPLIYPNF